MSKNLHYKVLASVLAIAGLYFYNASAAWADYRGDGTAISIDNNKIVINGQTTELQSSEDVYGNYQDSGDANDAVVTIKNKSNLDHVHGGFSASANANDNVVNIDNSTSVRVFGGYTNGKTENSNANGNKVIIRRKSTITGSSLYGGWSGYGSASGNTVTIENSIATNSNIWIIGGYALNTNKNSTISATGNTVKLIGSTNVENADIYGGRTDNSNPAGIDVTTGNKLILENWSGSVNSLNNFSDIYINNFTLNTNLINVGSVSGMEGVTIHLGAFTGDIALTAGDYAVGYNVKAAEIKWDSKLGSNVDFTIKDEDDKPIEAFAESLANQTINNTFYIEDRTDGDGVYATKFADKLDYAKGENSVSITAKVEKSVLAGKFIDENRQEHTNTQTPNRILTIGKDFKTNVGTVAGAYAAKKFDGTAQDATGGTVNIIGSTDWSGTIYAGYSVSGTVNNNTITVTSGTKAEKMSLSGYNNEAASTSQR